MGKGKIIEVSVTLLQSSRWWILVSKLGPGNKDIKNTQFNSYLRDGFVGLGVWLRMRGWGVIVTHRFSSTVEWIMVPSTKIEKSARKRLAGASKQGKISFGHAAFDIVCEEV